MKKLLIFLLSFLLISVILKIFFSYSFFNQFVKTSLNFPGELKVKKVEVSKNQFIYCFKGNSRFKIPIFFLGNFGGKNKVKLNFLIDGGFDFFTIDYSELKNVNFLSLCDYLSYFLPQAAFKGISFFKSNRLLVVAEGRGALLTPYLINSSNFKVGKVIFIEPDFNPFNGKRNFLSELKEFFSGVNFKYEDTLKCGTVDKVFLSFTKSNGMNSQLIYNISVEPKEFFVISGYRDIINIIGK